MTAGTARVADIDAEGRGWACPRPAPRIPSIAATSHHEIAWLLPFDRTREAGRGQAQPLLSHRSRRAVPAVVCVTTTDQKANPSSLTKVYPPI